MKANALPNSVKNPGQSLTCSTQIDDIFLPDLPSGWPVAVDTETSGLYVDGDPGTATKPAAPPARISVISLAFRDPDTNDVVTYAFPFDQGPVPGKAGRPIRDERTGRQQFSIITPEQSAKILASFHILVNPDTGRALLDAAGFAIPATLDQVRDRTVATAEVSDDLAMPNLGPDDYNRLIKWLAERDDLTMHNSKFDCHEVAAGLRQGAGGYAEVTEHYGAYDLLADNYVDSSIPFADRTAVEHNPGAVYGLAPLTMKRVLQGCGGKRRNVWDTLLVQNILDPLHTSALKPTSKRLWGDDQGDEQAIVQAALKKLGVGLGKRYDLIPWHLIGRYAARDTEQTLYLREYQENAIAEGAVPPKFTELIAEEFRTRTTLYNMEKVGTRYDRHSSLDESARLHTRMTEIARGLPFDPKRIADVKRYYFGLKSEGNLGLIPLQVTDKTSAPKLDEAEVRRLVDEGHPYAEAYDEYSHLRSAVSKWYDGWALRTGKDGRLRPNFRQGRIESDRPGQTAGGAISGRLSVERWQCQAIPNDFQIPKGSVSVKGKLIIPEPGHKLGHMDLPQGEVRIATAVAQCYPMYEVLKTGEDVHGSTATLVFGCRPGDDCYKEHRAVAKRLTFGVLYGAGIKTLQDQIFQFTGVKYSLAETKEFHNRYHETFPEFQRAARQAQYKVDRGYGGAGFVTLINGRRRWYGYAEKTTSAFNQVIQGGLAEVAKHWMNRVNDEFPGALLLQVHDALVLEVPDNDTGTAQLRRAADIGEQLYHDAFSLRGMDMTFPIEVEAFGAPAPEDLRVAA